MKEKFFIFVLLATVIFITLPGSDTFAQTGNQQSNNVSSVLRQFLQESAGSNVKIIIQLNASPSGQLNALLQRNGIRVKGRFANLNMIALDLPANLAGELTSFPE